jgi:hypothetical protein
MRAYTLLHGAAFPVATVNQKIAHATLPSLFSCHSFLAAVLLRVHMRRYAVPLESGAPWARGWMSVACQPSRG